MPTVSRPTTDTRALASGERATVVRASPIDPHGSRAGLSASPDPIELEGAGGAIAAGTGVAARLIEKPASRRLWHGVRRGIGNVTGLRLLDGVGGACLGFCWGLGDCVRFLRRLSIRLIGRASLRFPSDGGILAGLHGAGSRAAGGEQEREGEWSDRHARSVTPMGAAHKR
jgi:hypothetical protein